MTASKVYFMDMRASYQNSLMSKLSKVMDAGGISEVISERDLVAIKLHFGEKGNTAFIRPIFLAQVVDKVKAHGGSPFLTDANTLYAGTRGNSVSHLVTAVENGFAYSVVKAPLIIADGLRGAAFEAVDVNLDLVKVAYIGKEIHDADAIIGVAHFKGHEVTGFGGTIKNIGMGCASRKGKMDQHSGLSPKVRGKKCIGCGLCSEHCAHKAISLKDEKAVIDPALCVGCAECILICPQGAIDAQWDSDSPRLQKKMVEYTAAVLNKKKGKALFINFITSVSPACDCYGHSDAPIVRDIGIVLSKDPVAIDQASADLVNGQHALEGSCLTTGKGPGEDKFKAVYPRIDWSVQLDYAQELGLGSRTYDIVSITK
ncbi:MAG: DUF362 domain-containing protein [Desulfobacteraceae bacterium]|nr:MAG: DUF362 domain-containing protein [Desulfobacteraceae bacterium]